MTHAPVCFSRFRIGRSAILSIAILLVLATPAILQAADRPNILFIIADDQSPFDLKAYNPDTALETPVLDQLAAEGMTIDGAYHMGSWSGAVCTPSRHMVMSGRTLWHLPGQKRNKKKVKSGIADVVGLNRAPADLPEHTMAAVFNRAGYETMRTCKTGNSYEAANRQFTHRHDAMKRGGTEESGSGWHAQQVLNFLNDRESAKADNPFLIYFGFSHPHDTRDGTPELLSKYGAVNHSDPASLPPANDSAPQLPVNYLPAHPFDHGHPNLRDEVSVSGVWKRRDPTTIRNELGREFACSENIDIQIGRVLKKLEAMGELENTYIVYTSDHGMAIGRHGLQGKQNLYQHTWRVPMIVKGPGIKAASRAEGNVYLLDVLATICDLTDVDPPKTNEGSSFAPVLKGQQTKIRDVLYGAYCGGTKPGMRCVKQGDWKLIKYDVLNGTVRQTQLFNLATNPHEFLTQHHAAAVRDLTGIAPTEDQVNLADDPRFAEKRKELEALLLSQQQQYNDPYRLWDQPQID